MFPFVFPSDETKNLIYFMHFNPKPPSSATFSVFLTPGGGGRVRKAEAGNSFGKGGGGCQSGLLGTCLVISDRRKRLGGGFFVEGFSVMVIDEVGGEGGDERGRGEGGDLIIFQKKKIFKRFFAFKKRPPTPLQKQDSFLIKSGKGKPPIPHPHLQSER